MTLKSPSAYLKNIKIQKQFNVVSSTLILIIAVFPITAVALEQEIFSSTPASSSSVTHFLISVTFLALLFLAAYFYIKFQTQPLKTSSAVPRSTQDSKQALPAGTGNQQPVEAVPAAAAFIPLPSAASPLDAIRESVESIVFTADEKNESPTASLKASSDTIDSLVEASDVAELPTPKETETFFQPAFPMTAGHASVVAALLAADPIEDKLDSAAVTNFVESLVATEDIAVPDLVSSVIAAGAPIEACAVLRRCVPFASVKTIAHAAHSAVCALLHATPHEGIAQGLRWLLAIDAAATPPIEIKDCDFIEHVLQHIKQRQHPTPAAAEDFLFLKKLAVSSGSVGAHLRTPKFLMKIMKCIFTSTSPVMVAADVCAISSVCNFAQLVEAGDKLVSFGARAWNTSEDCAVRRSLESFVLLLLEQAGPKLLAVVDAVSPDMADALRPSTQKHSKSVDGEPASNLLGTKPYKDDINSVDWRFGARPSPEGVRGCLSNSTPPSSCRPNQHRKDFPLSLVGLGAQAGLAAVDATGLVRTREGCDTAVNECRNTGNLPLASALLAALEAKLIGSVGSTTAPAGNGRKWMLQEVQTLLSVFVQFDDLHSTGKCIRLLQRFGETSAQSYELATSVCCRLGQLPQALHYVNHAIACGPSQQTKLEDTAVVSPPGIQEENAKDIAEAAAVVAPSDAIRRAVRMYLFALAELRQLDDALEFLLEVAGEKKIELDPATIAHVLTKILKSQPDQRTVKRILNVILPSRTRPPAHELRAGQFIDEGLFGALVDVCVKYRIDDALVDLVERYRDEWSELFVPDLQSCGILIKMLGVCGRVDDCRWIFRHVTKTPGVEPTEVTYGCILDALVNNNRVAEAVTLFEEMRSTGKVKPNTIMYSTIVKGYAQEKQLDKALAINEDMRKHKVPINTVTYNTLVDACARVGAMDKAAGLLEDMLTSGVEPDLITFSTIAKGYCVQGDVARAMQLLTAMRERGIRPDGILYNSLLDGCVRALRPDLCEQLWQQMQSSGIPPSNFTLTILIKMFGRAGKLTRAFEAVRQLPKKYGFSINAHVYTCLMSACIANKEFAKSLEVFQCMQKDDVQPDAKTYETVLYGLARWGNFTEAVRMVRIAFQLDAPPAVRRQKNNKVVGLQMDPRSMKNLWAGLKYAGQLELAQQTMKDIEACHGAAGMKYLSSPGAVNIDNYDYGQNKRRNNYYQRSVGSHPSSTAASSIESSHGASKEQLPATSTRRAHPWEETPATVPEETQAVHF